MEQCRLRINIFNILICFTLDVSRPQSITALLSVIICLHLTSLMHGGFSNMSVLLTAEPRAALTFRVALNTNTEALWNTNLSSADAQLPASLSLWRHHARRRNQIKSLSRINIQFRSLILSLRLMQNSKIIQKSYFWCLIRVYLNVWFNFQYCVLNVIANKIKVSLLTLVSSQSICITFISKILILNFKKKKMS